MNSISSQAVAAESLPADCLATDRSAMSNASHTAAGSSRNESRMGFSTMHPSIVGLSESLLTAVTLPVIRAWLTASAQDSPVLHSVSPENDSQTKTLETLGQKPETQSESSGLGSPSSKTCPGSSQVRISKRYAGIFEGLDIECVQPCLAQSTLERHTLENGSGCWPTPVASEVRQGLQIRRDGKKGTQQSLTTAVKLYPSPMPSDVHGGRTTKGIKRPNEGGLRKAPFPTPRSEDGQSCGAHRGQPDTLTSFVKLWPTPQCRDAQTVDKCKRGANSPGGTPLPVAVGSTLNPTWVEILMGWPGNWSDLLPMSTIEFYEWIQGFRKGLQEMREVIPTVEEGPKGGTQLQLHQKEILLNGMLPQCAHQAEPEAHNAALEEQKVPKEELSSLRDEDSSASSPHQRAAVRLPEGESSNALHLVPQVSSRYGRQAWISGTWEASTPRTSDGTEDRVQRLEAIGAGQCPLVAAVAFIVLSKGLI